MLLCWFFCTGARTGPFRRNSNTYVNNYGNACYSDPQPDSCNRNRDCHKYPYRDSHADKYCHKHSYMDSIPHSDAFLYADRFVDALHHSLLDAESQQYADEHTCYADRYSDTHDHAVPIDVRRSSISKVTALCLGSFG